MHHDDYKFIYRVFENGAYVGSFMPDEHDFLHFCQNPGGLDEELLHLLDDQIEAHHLMGMIDNIRN